MSELDGWREVAERFNASRIAHGWIDRADPTREHVFYWDCPECGSRTEYQPGDLFSTADTCCERAIRNCEGYRRAWSGSEKEPS